MKTSCSTPWRLVSPLMPWLALGLVACGGGGTGDGPQPPQATDKAVLTASRPGDLAAYVQARLRRLDAEGRLASAGSAVSSDGLQPTAVSAVSAAGLAAAPPRSATLVQEDGVDEADLIQTDGRHLYTLQPHPAGGPVLVVHERAADGQAQVRARLQLPADGATSVTTDGMVLSADQRTLAVLSQHWTAVPSAEACGPLCLPVAPLWMRSSVNVQRVDVGQPGAALAGDRISIDGSLVDSRRIGDKLYLVTAHRPVLAVEQLPGSASPAERDAAIAALKAADLLPRLRRNGGAAEPLLTDTACYLQTANASDALQLTTITVIDLSSASLARSSRCFLGGSEAVYLSPRNLYLATTRWTYPSGAVAWVYPADISTDIHKFALDAGGPSYRGTGTVPGHLGWDPLRKSYRLSEHRDDLRVLSFTGSDGWFTVQDAQTKPASPATLTVLRERPSDGSLQAVSTLPNAGRPAHLGKPGEQVHAVRFLGDRAYVVTFRRTDPLYVLDLADPADPRAVGELEVTGFSDHLFPLPNQLLLGVGREADASGVTAGLKLTLFDVADPARPAQRASLSLGAAGSASALDSTRHGLSLLRQDHLVRLALPVTLAGSPFADWQHGLQKLEIDTTARSLRNLGLAGPPDPSAQAPLGLERSAHIADSLYYLRAGSLETYPW